MLPVPRVEAVISDFGGVLTSPLIGSFAAFTQASGISLEELGKAIAVVGAQRGVNPLFDLEIGRLSEAEFLGAIAVALTEQLGRPVELDGFGERYFANLEPNQALIDYMRQLRRRGYRLAICTNNVREWEPLWRAMLPVDEIFDVVVDSAFVGTRKPDRRIYDLTLERLGVAAPAALLIDDLELNCEAAREIGIRAVWFRSTEQAIEDTEAALSARARLWPSMRRRASVGLAVLGMLAVIVAVLVATGSGGGVDPVGSGGSNASSDPVSPPATLARARFPITVGGPVGQPIRPGFLGLSIEFQAIRAYTGADPRRINPVLVQLIRNLTPDQSPVIRIGGDSTDASWVPTRGVTPPPEITYGLTPGWFATTGALARALGARMTMGLNLATDKPALAATEARRDVRVFGSTLEAFEIGNEPNVYDVIAAYHTPSGGSVTSRPPGYNYADYLKEFRASAAVLPPLALAGPALATGPKPDKGSWIQSMPSFLASQPRVRTLTIHRYPLRHCFVGPGSPQYPTVAHLLAGYATIGLDNSVRRYVAIAHSHGRQLRVDELNSVACRGKTGVSDTFASGLWVLDALFGLARTGVDGVNLHTLPRSAYQLFKFSRSGGRWRASVPPVYYGLDMFARAAPPGSRLLRISGAPRGARLSVWATRALTGQVRVVAINKSPSRRQTVTLHAPSGAGGTATVLRMRAPGIQARSGITIGDMSFGSETYTGVLPPPRTETLSARRGAYSLSLPRASAALVTFGAG